jgi:hypothetical protein
LVAAGLTVSLALPFLVRDRDIMFSLPHRRDAQIEGGPQRHGHVGNLLTSSSWPEQFVEYVDLGVRDRHARGPIVYDAPGLNVVFDRTTNARSGLVLDGKIVGQDADASAHEMVFAMKGAWSRYADSIARAADKQNGANRVSPSLQ